MKRPFHLPEFHFMSATSTQRTPYPVWPNGDFGAGENIDSSHRWRGNYHTIESSSAQSRQAPHFLAEAAPHETDWDDASTAKHSASTSSFTCDASRVDILKDEPSRVNHSV